MKIFILILVCLTSIFEGDFIYSQRGGDDRIKRIKSDRNERIDKIIVRERVIKTKTPVAPKRRDIHRLPERPTKIEIEYPLPEEKGFTICGDVKTPLQRNIDTYIHLPTKESGINKIELEDYEGAISDFTIVMEEDPYDEELYYYRGFAYNKIEQYDSADVDLSNAIYLDYYYWEAYFQRGIARVNLGDTNSAMNDFHVADSLKLAFNDSLTGAD